MRIRLSLAAESDVRDIHTWYKTQRQDLAVEFRNALENCLHRIQNHPAVYPKVHGEVRRALLQTFPYCVFYVMSESEVKVIGVFHGHRDPKRWKLRSIP